MWPRIKLEVPFFKKGGPGGRGSAIIPEAASFLTKLISWHDFESNLNDGWGPYPITQSVSGVTYGTPPVLSGSNFGTAFLQNGKGVTRSAFPQLSTTSHGVGAFCYTGVFSNSFSGETAGLGGGSQTAHYILKTVSVGQEGWKARAANVSPANVEASPTTPTAINTVGLAVSEYDHTAKKIYLHRNGSLIHAQSATFAPALYTTNRLNVGEASGGYPSESSMTALFTYRGKLTAGELTYLWNGGKARNIAGIISDSGYEQPRFRLTQSHPLGYTYPAVSYSGNRVAHNVTDAVTCIAYANYIQSGGKYVFACRMNQALTGGSSYIGFRNDDLSSGAFVFLSNAATSTYQDGEFSLGTAPGLSVTAANDIYMFAVDFPSLKVWLGKNGTFSGDPVAGTNPTFTIASPQELFIFCQENDVTFGAEFYFTSDDYPYTIPTGYSAWADNL